jgi:exonuclease SbcD
MKIMHLGDLHLGRTLGEFDLIQDQEYILNEILDIAKRENVDALVMAGDIYDKRIPSEAAVNLLDVFLSRLAKENLKTLIISGNHDSDDRLGFGSSLFEVSGIYISSRFNGKPEKVVLEDQEGEVNFYLLPFIKASQVRHFYPDDEIETYDDAVRAVLDHTEIDYSKRNVLVAHQFVAGKEDPVTAGSENAATISVGLVEKIGYGVFEDFDYVALGHIHSPQQVGCEHIRYSGSPLKYSLSEVNNEKSVPVITLGKKGEREIDLLPLKPMRNLRHIRGELKKLLDESNIIDPEDFIYVTLTDENMVNDAMGIIQQYYPNTVKIDYDNSHTRELERVDIASIAENKTFSELISDFYKQIYGCDITEEEISIMEEVAREAGVIDEAN